MATYWIPDCPKDFMETFGIPFSDLQMLPDMHYPEGVVYKLGVRAHPLSSVAHHRINKRIKINRKQKAEKTIEKQKAERSIEKQKAEKTTEEQKVEKIKGTRPPR